MNLRHVYCIPDWADSSEQTLSTVELLAKVESTMKIPFDKVVFQNEPDHKEELMWLSVRYGIRLPQTARSKELRYPHLILRDEDNPVIFYPQMRRGKNGRIEISIKTYLEKLLEGHVKSLVEIPALMRYQVEKFNLLRNGYLEMAKEAKLLNKTWETADSKWPE